MASGLGSLVPLLAVAVLPIAGFGLLYGYLRVRGTRFSDFKDARASYSPSTDSSFLGELLEDSVETVTEPDLDEVDDDEDEVFDDGGDGFDGGFDGGGGGDV
jgi:hypothetical protein